MLSDRERRTVVVGAALAAIIVAFWGFQAARSPDDGAPAPDDVYARFEALASQKEATRAALERARVQEARLAERLLGPNEAAVAAATLTALVEETARRSGVRIDQQLALEPETVAEALLAIPLQLSLSLDVLGLRQFLYELERTPPTLIVEDVTIASLTSGGGGGGGMPPLQVQLTVKGLIPAAAESEAPAAEGGAP
jgi:hypothetical protein